MNTKAWIIYRHCVRSQFFLKYVFQICNVKYNNQIMGIPMGILPLYLEYLPMGYVPTMHSF